MGQYRAFNTLSSYWMEGNGRDDDIVISSRVRLARNAADMPFPAKLNLNQERKFLERLQSIPLEKAANGIDNLDFYDLSIIPREEKLVLVEKHQISPELALSQGVSGLLINAAETISVMINEEDHFRIQSIYPGLSLKECYDKASQIDDMIGGIIPYAWSSRYGYLTACPTNTGTGLRASVMLHLPGLVMGHKAKKIFGNLRKYGFTARGLYGEGTDGKGNIFQISNEITLGISEDEIIKNLMEFTEEIVAMERDIRKTVLQQDRIALENKIFRAKGILESARLLEIDEAFQLLSLVKMGTDLKLLQGYDKKTFNQKLLWMQPVILEKISRRKLSDRELQEARANLFRKKE